MTNFLMNFFDEFFDEFYWWIFLTVLVALKWCFFQVWNPKQLILENRLLIKIYFIFQSFYCTCHPIFEETQLWWFGFGLGISQMLASWLQNRACFWQKGFCWLGTRTLKGIKKRRYVGIYILLTIEGACITYRDHCDRLSKV